MTKEIVKTKIYKNAETLMAVYIYIYISIHLQTSGIRLLDHTHIFYRNVQLAMKKIQCSNTFIQVAILLKKRKNKKAKSVFEKICFINSVKEKGWIMYQHKSWHVVCPFCAFCGSCVL